jgi:contractile injection system tube protein
MGFSGALEKMTVLAYDSKDFKKKVGEFTVFINPAKYTHAYKVLYNDVQAQGSSGVAPSFNRTKSDKVTFELVFDGTGVVPSPLPGVVPFTGDGVAEQLEAFKKLCFTYNGNIHSPNYLKLVWGTLLFKSVLDTLSVAYTLFKPDGTPLRARATATFLGYNDEVELALKARKSSPDLSHLVTVKGGDTLPLLCDSVYGGSRYYVQVARANGLTGFRRLAVGSTLLLPPLASRAE